MEARPVRSTSRVPSIAVTSWTVVTFEGRLDLVRVGARLPWTAGERDAMGVSFATEDEVSVHLLGRGAMLVEGAGPDAFEIARDVEAASGRRLLMETVQVWRIADGVADTSIDGEQIVHCPRDPSARRTLALLLAEYAALRRCESVVDRLSDDASAIASDLRDAARLPWSNRRATRRTGTLLQARIELSNWLAPQYRGEDDPAEGWHRAFSQSLGLPRRRAELRDRLASAEDALQTLLAMWNSRRSHALEWIIIALIAVDVVIATLLHA